MRAGDRVRFTPSHNKSLELTGIVDAIDGEDVTVTVIADGKIVELQHTQSVSAKDCTLVESAPEFKCSACKDTGLDSEGDFCIGPLDGGDCEVGETKYQANKAAEAEAYRVAAEQKAAAEKAQAEKDAAEKAEAEKKAADEKADAEAAKKAADAEATQDQSGQSD